MALARRTFVGKVMSLLFNMLSRLVIAFLTRSKQASLNFMAAVTICSDFGAQENKESHCFHCFPIYVPWSDGTLVFWILTCKPTFSLPFFTFIKRLFSFASLSSIRVVSSAYLRHKHLKFKKRKKLHLGIEGKTGTFCLLNLHFSEQSCLHSPKLI